MKKLMILFVAILFAGTLTISACDAPDGYRKYQTVQPWSHIGGYGPSIQVFANESACNAFCVCYRNSIFYVSASDKPDFKYMFWYGKVPYYFNM